MDCSTRIRSIIYRYFMRIICKFWVSSLSATFWTKILPLKTQSFNKFVPISPDKPHTTKTTRPISPRTPMTCYSRYQQKENNLTSIKTRLSLIAKPFSLGTCLPECWNPLINMCHHWNWKRPIHLRSAWPHPKSSRPQKLKTSLTTKLKVKSSSFSRNY